MRPRQPSPCRFPPASGGPTRRARPAGPCRAGAAVLAAALFGALGQTATAVAQDGPAGGAPDAADGSTTVPTPPSEPPASPGTAPRTAGEPAAPVPLDLASIDAILAEARASAQRLRDAQIAAAAEAVRVAEAEVAGALDRLAEARLRHDEAVARVSALEADAEAVRRRIGAIAANAYMQVGTERDETVARLRVGTGASDSAAVDAQQTRIYAGGAIDATRAELRALRRRIADATRAERAARDVVSERRSELDTLEAVATEARSAEAALRTAPLDVPAAATVRGLFGALGPTILGRSLLSAEDLAAFVRARGRPHPLVDVETLAGHFIAEGEAEGVRADLAWAQSIIETGYFGFAGSMVAPTDHNYAGIGACDSCTRGFDYDTPQLGVRAQMQLLRTYADRGLTAERLAHPPVGRPPERVGVRGCCPTWMALSGVWATGPQYGAKILGLYNEMLRFAVERRLAGSPPAVPAPPSVPPVGG